MAKMNPRYAPEFKEQMVALVRSGRSPESLAQEFPPSTKTIREWASRPTWTKAGEPMASPRPSARSCADFAVRTSGSG